MVTRSTSTKKKYTEEVVDKAASNKVLNLSEYKPSPKQQYNEEAFRGTLDNPNSAGAVFFTVPESDNRELQDDREDLYAKYDQMLEPDADQYLINNVATIISSSITLTDSSGNNHTFVRRDTRNSETTYY